MLEFKIEILVSIQNRGKSCENSKKVSIDLSKFSENNPNQDEHVGKKTLNTILLENESIFVDFSLKTSSNILKISATLLYFRFENFL